MLFRTQSPKDTYAPLLEAIHGEDVGKIRSLHRDFHRLHDVEKSEIFRVIDEKENIPFAAAVCAQLFPSEHERDLALPNSIQEKRHFVAEALLQAGVSMVGITNATPFAASCGDSKGISLLASHASNPFMVRARALYFGMVPGNEKFCLEQIEAGALRGGVKAFEFITLRRGNEFGSSFGEIFWLFERAIQNELGKVFHKLTEVFRLPDVEMDYMFDLAFNSGKDEIMHQIMAQGGDFHAYAEKALSRLVEYDDIHSVAKLLCLGSRVSEEALSNPGSIRMNRFWGLVLPIFIGVQQSDSRESLAYSLGLSNIPKLKTDAFLSEGSWQTRPFIQALFCSASAAVTLENGKERADSIFKRLILADIDRVESTTGLSWRRYYNALCGAGFRLDNFADLVREVADVLVFPILVRKERAKGVYIEDDQELIQKKQNEAADLACRHLSTGKSTLELSSLNAKWHRAGNRCPDDLRPLLAQGQWFPLFDDPVDVGNGWTVECLKGADELIQEGNSLSHCVGGYSSMCYEGNTQILSVRRNGASIATIELRRSQRGTLHFPDGTRWSVVQFKGHDNSTPSGSTYDAFERFKTLLFEKKISINSSEGMTPETRRRLAALGKINRITGFELEDTDRVREKLLEHYRERVFVERRMGGEKVRISLISDEMQIWLENLTDV